MSEKDIIQNMITQLGQSQDERVPPELDPHFIEVDERSGRDLLKQAQAMAKHVCFYRHTPDFSSGNWESFFPGEDAALDTRDDGQTPPHLGLFGTFLQLYRYPQQAINTVTGRHLDFQMRDVLRFTPKPEQADHAHLLLELKKGAAPVAITPAQRFSAGKDAKGVELIYQPVREIVIGHGKVDGLHSIFHDASGIYFAPVANSSDGLGGAFKPPRNPDQAKWRAFGKRSIDGTMLPAAHIGFALAAPVLRMHEGVRRVQVDLQLTNLDASKHNGAALATAFEAHLTGPKGWQGPFHPEATLAGDTLSLSFTVPASSPAVVDYNALAHGLSFAAQAPILQLLLKPDSTLRYDDLRDLWVGSVRIKVNVDGLTAITLENDNGSLNPKKTFLPFGPQPVIGSRFMIGCDEALSKSLLDLKIKLTWQGAPANLSTWYSGYTRLSQISNGVSTNLVYQDRSGQTQSSVVNIMAPDNAGVETLSPNAPSPTTLPITNQFDSRLYALFSGGNLLSRLLGRRMMMKWPATERHAIPAPPARSGYITFALNEDFLHTDYRHESVQHAVNQDKIVLNEPYTPKVQAISISYQAQSDKVDIGANSEDSFTNLDLQFFHIGCFGQRRDAGYLRAQLNYVEDKPVGLLPGYPGEGEFLIGITGVTAGDAVSLLMQVAQGSADPDLPPQKLAWSVLCDNYWRALTAQELVLDTSNHLRTSGIVTVVLPHETSTVHTWLASGHVWLRASIALNSAAVCQLQNVAANALEVSFVDQQNDPAHLATVLAAASISKLKDPQAAIKSVSQPDVGFGGKQQETGHMLTRRAAERLRHRQRCIAPWDYERMLLEAFPMVHKVKCVPHASDASWLAPGHVMLVVIPDLRNQNAMDRLQPRVDIDTLARMTEFAQGHCAGQITIKVKNPRYQAVRVDFKVRFRSGFAFNYYRGQLQEALIRMLSPWAWDTTRMIEFGGRIYRSVLLDFVEELPYVDFVTDFKMGLASGDGSLLKDVPEISVDAPDAILVSDLTHTIGEVF